LCGAQHTFSPLATMEENLQAALAAADLGTIMAAEAFTARHMGRGPREMFARLCPNVVLGINTEEGDTDGEDAVARS
jgi:hypothetical protein